MYMTRKLVILTTASMPEQRLTHFRTTGAARSAGYRKMISIPLKGGTPEGRPQGRPSAFMNDTMKTIRYIWVTLALLLGATPSTHAIPGLAGAGFQLDPKLRRTPTGIELAVTVSIADGHYLYASGTSVEARTDGVTLEPLTTLDAKQKDDPYQGGLVEIYPTSGIMRFRVLPPTEPLTIELKHWGCNETTCFIPSSQEVTLTLEETTTPPPAATNASPITTASPIPADLTVAGTAGGYLDSKAFLDFLDRVESGTGTTRNLAQEILSRYGVVLGILVLMGFGFLLNLTPCVLPMIPVNIAIIGAGVQAGSRSRGLLMGGIYGLGMALTYGALGLIVVLTGSQFGTLNASPWFNGTIAIIFLVLSLAMFGVYELDLSRFQKSGIPGQAPSRAPAVTAFVMGSVAALLAGACVAPVLISVLVMATNIYQGGNPAGLLLPFVLGLGMALPWPIVGAGFAILPKPGNWMVRVRAAFGVIILAAALFYGFQAVKLVRGTVVDDDGWWMHDYDEAVALAQASGQPLFVDFWATWCKSCLKMNKTTFKEPDVKARLEPYVRVKVRVDGPDDEALLDALGGEGLPHYAIINHVEHVER
jgi:thiol:disulfide interchange protein DsbD